MKIKKIEEILNKENIHNSHKYLLETLEVLKKNAVKDNEEKKAKYIWCLEKIYLIKTTFEKAFLDLQKNEFKEAWYKFDKCDIELGFLKKHFNFKKNECNLLFIENEIPKYQKLFPYTVFFSRESIESDFTCSICGAKVGIKSRCEHKIGEIYNGKMCCRKAEKIEFLAMALVNNPVDKYTVAVTGRENYCLLETLIEYVKDPYEDWSYDIIPLKESKYQNTGRNEKCPCHSNKKYKNCCINEKRKHFKFKVNNNDPNKKPLPFKTFNLIKKEKPFKKKSSVMIFR